MMTGRWISEVEKRISYTFNRPELLEQAFTHTSYANQKHLDYDNERLEFLGDSVLGFVVAADLYERFTDEPEGTLTQIKSFMTAADALATMAERLGLHLYLLVDDHDRAIRHNQKLKENLFEAVIGAVYLDGGLDAVRKVILNIYDVTRLRVDEPGAANVDHKTRLQECFQALGIGLPAYVVVERKGPVHDAEFVVELRYKDLALATGAGRSKKQAHQEAARELLALTGGGETLEQLLHDRDPDLLT